MQIGAGQTQKNIFHINNTVLDIVPKMKYLGIIINQKGKCLIEDRIEKANRAIHVLKQALFTTGNVSCKLALSIFDKQILTILSYGSPIWGIPHTTNYIYIENIHQRPNFKEEVYRNIDKESITMLRRVGKISDKPRKILVQLNSFKEKQNALKLDLPSFTVHNYDLEYDKGKHEKVQNMCCEFVLNITKYASNDAVRAELGRYPLSFHIWTNCVKYWTWI